MAVETLTTPRSNLPNTYDEDILARELDFVTRFAKNWEALRQILGIARPIKKQSGTQLKAYTATVTLAGGNVPAGAVIPYSKSTVTKKLFEDLAIQKYAKATPIEDVDRYGVEVAIEKTDEAFQNELQGVVMTSFYNSILNNTYAITGEEDGFQMAVSIAIGDVKNKFQQLRRNVSSVIVWVNTLDLYRYIGAAQITVQKEFGVEYLKGFPGADTMTLSSAIPSRTVVAIPTDNLVNYCADPSSTDFAKLGLVYTTDGETDMIGYHVNGNYSTAVGETFALFGMVLYFEFADGMAKITFPASTEETGG
jgi:hypothetical protein